MSPRNNLIEASEREKVGVLYLFSVIKCLFLLNNTLLIGVVVLLEHHPLFIGTHLGPSCLWRIGRMFIDLEKSTCATKLSRIPHSGIISAPISLDCLFPSLLSPTRFAQLFYDPLNGNKEYPPPQVAKSWLMLLLLFINTHKQSQISSVQWLMCLGDVMRWSLKDNKWNLSHFMLHDNNLY